jgi:hypothetical protein
MEIHIEKKGKTQVFTVFTVLRLGFFCFLHINKGVDQH